MTPWAGDETRVLEIMDWIARGWVEPKCPPEWHWVRVRQGFERQGSRDVSPADSGLTSVQTIWTSWFPPPLFEVRCSLPLSNPPSSTSSTVAENWRWIFQKKKKWAKKYQKCGHQLKQRPGRIQLKFLDKILGPSPPSSAARCINTASPPSMRYWGLRVSVLL